MTTNTLQKKWKVLFMSLHVNIREYGLKLFLGQKQHWNNHHNFFGEKTKNKHFRIQLEIFSFFHWIHEEYHWVSLIGISLLPVLKQNARDIQLNLNSLFYSKWNSMYSMSSWMILNTQTNEYNEQISYLECVANTLCNTIFRRTKKSSFEVQSHKNGP